MIKLDGGAYQSTIRRLAPILRCRLGAGNELFILSIPERVLSHKVTFTSARRVLVRTSLAMRSCSPPCHSHMGALNARMWVRLLVVGKSTPSVGDRNSLPARGLVNFRSIEPWMLLGVVSYHRILDD